MTNPPPNGPAPEYVRRVCRSCHCVGEFERIDATHIKCASCSAVRIDDDSAVPRKPPPTDPAQRRLAKGTGHDAEWTTPTAVEACPAFVTCGKFDRRRCINIGGAGHDGDCYARIGDEVFRQARPVPLTDAEVSTAVDTAQAGKLVPAVEPLAETLVRWMQQCNELECARNDAVKRADEHTAKLTAARQGERLIASRLGLDPDTVSSYVQLDLAISDLVKRAERAEQALAVERGDTQDGFNAATRRMEHAEHRAADLALQLDKAKVELGEAEQRHRKSDWARERALEDWRAERARADAAERRLAELTAAARKIARYGYAHSEELHAVLDRQARESGQAPAVPRTSVSPHYAWRERGDVMRTAMADSAEDPPTPETAEGREGELTAEFVARCICTDDGLSDCDTTREEAIALVNRYARQHAEPLAARVAELVPALAERDAELERERMRLAACLEAAEGWPVRNGMLAEYDSDALRAIERLRQHGEINVVALKAQAEKLAKLRAEHTDVLAERDAMQSLATQNGREVERLREAAERAAKLLRNLQNPSSFTDIALETIREALAATPVPAEPAAPVLSDEERAVLERVAGSAWLAGVGQDDGAALRVLCRLALADDGRAEATEIVRGLELNLQQFIALYNAHIRDEHRGGRTHEPS